MTRPHSIFVFAVLLALLASPCASGRKLRQDGSQTGSIVLTKEGAVVESVSVGPGQTSSGSSASTDGSASEGSFSTSNGGGEEQTSGFAGSLPSDDSSPADDPEPKPAPQDQEQQEPAKDPEPSSPPAPKPQPPEWPQEQEATEEETAEAEHQDPAPAPMEAGTFVQRSGTFGSGTTTMAIEESFSPTSSDTSLTVGVGDAADGEGSGPQGPVEPDTTHQSGDGSGGSSRVVVMESSSGPGNMGFGVPSGMSQADSSKQAWRQLCGGDLAVRFEVVKRLCSDRGF